MARDCPEVQSWQALLDGTLPAEQREPLESHLQSCAACQELLDQSPECAETLRILGKQLGDPTATPVDQHLTAVLNRLHSFTTPLHANAELADLFFLQPTDRPELLGMLGPYEVREVIGQGGMGIVLSAYEPALHRLVAIKVLTPALAGSPTARRRFTREARAAAAVAHDHIVAVHGVHEANGLPYLVMQFVPGESLQDRLDRSCPLDIMDTVRIGLQTASGLAAAHAQGLVHRDIKPANLLLEDGLARVRITDFGLARSIDDVAVTQAGVVHGTPEYMAPEQARGEPVDHRADLFSLGSVLYAMCTGEPPFQAPSTVAVLRKVSDEEPPPIRTLNPSVPDWLIQLIGRLLAKNPAERIQSAADVAALLEGYLAHLRQPDLPAPVLPPLAHSSSASGETNMLLFACSACGAKVRTRPELAGKKVKCPHCGAALAVPVLAPAPAVRKKNGPALVLGGIGLTLGLVLLLAGLRFWWFAEDSRKSFLDIDLGNHAVSGVEDSGFHHDERNPEGIPFRWTDGHARLVIPLDRSDPPEALLVRLVWLRNSRLQIKVNGRELVNDRNGAQETIWEKTLDLRGMELGDRLVLELLSDTLVPSIESQGQNTDARTLGVRVRLVKLLRHRDPEPALPSFLEVPLGTLTTPGVEDSGFHRGEEKTNKGVFRWTDGNARLVIPLNKKEPLPQALLVRLDWPKNRWLRITVNGRILVSEKTSDRPMNWREWVLDLRPITLGERVVVELASNAASPREENPNLTDERPVGVKVRLIKLLPTAELLTPPAGSFLNVTVGNRYVPGVEDGGFYDGEKGQNGLFRWTKDRARLVIPLDKNARPQAVLVALGVPNTRAFRIAANGRELIKENANRLRPWLWQKTLSLAGVPLEDKLVIEIEANTRPMLTQPNGNPEARELGVAVRGIRLLAPSDQPGNARLIP
jgi:serine/threonine protein kinase